jgi:two-component system sensor histidine kinase CpxA
MPHEEIRLIELVQQLVDDAHIEAEARGVRLRYVTREPVVVAGDAELLRRSIENVLRNAIRYTPADSAITIEVLRQGDKALVRIRDRGPGVPEEALPRLFDAFYRVEPDRNRNSGGIGLGLSIARRAVELHKGTIRARNADPGLEVTIALPAEAGYQLSPIDYQPSSREA